MLGAVVGGIVTLAAPKEYSATSSVYIGQTTDANGNPMAGLNSNSKAATQLLTSQVVLEEAAQRLKDSGMKVSAGRLRKETTVVTPSSTVKTSTSVVNIVVITVTDTDKVRAAAAANALAEVLVERISPGVTGKIVLLEAQLAQGKKAMAAVAEAQCRGTEGAARHRQGRRPHGGEGRGRRALRGRRAGRRHRAGGSGLGQPEDRAAAVHSAAGGGAARAARGRRAGLAERARA